MSTAIGKPLSRVDGRVKVTGQAKYAAEFNVPGLTYGVVVSSAIAKGEITAIDPRQALALPGVLEVFTHENRPDVAWLDLKYKDQDTPPGSPFRPLRNAKIQYSGQPIALVVAETFELARYAATLLRVEYDSEEVETDILVNQHKSRKPKHGVADLLKPPPPRPRGDFDAAFAAAPVKVTGQYVHMAEHHNPMEMFATTAIPEENGKWTIYDKTQGVTNSHLYVAQVFNIPFRDLRILSPYVGGGFGSGLRPQYQLFMAVLAARALQRPVRVSLTRQQMFTFGHRPATIQNVALGAQPNGTLDAMYHQAIAETSKVEDYTEVVVNWSGQLYQCDNVTLEYKLVPLDVYSPLDMRAPGGVTGIPVIETAMDELAHKLGMDPIELRLKNYTDWDHALKRPFSSKELRECYRQGAERFGWAARNPEPRSMRNGRNLVGWGMATGMWEANQLPARAEASLGVNGKLWVSSATADIGTGTYTIMTQIAADTLGVPVEDVVFKLGDSDFPLAPIQGGSWTAATVGTAVKEACEAVGKSLLKLAQNLQGSPFKKAKFGDVEFVDGWIRLKAEPAEAISLVNLVRLNGGRAVRETATGIPNFLQHKKYTRAAHAAAFVEVQIDEELGTIEVSRVVTAIAGGRILNPKTARSQILGGVVWGISKSLHEESVLDHRFGRFMNHNLAEYHVSVNADIHDIDVIFVEEHDDIVNPLGVKGLGEIGIVAMPAAVANAVFHATGKRVRDLPITLDKIL